jgi:hypothetical protein
MSSYSSSAGSSGHSSSGSGVAVSMGLYNDHAVLPGFFEQPVKSFSSVEAAYADYAARIAADDASGGDKKEKKTSFDSSFLFIAAGLLVVYLIWRR